MMESLLVFLEPLTRLLSTVVVIVLFFLFIVRPLLNYLFVNDEIESHKKRFDAMSMDGVADDAEDSAHADDESLMSKAVDKSPKLSEKDAINRLAASDPERASQLVKKWTNSG